MPGGAAVRKYESCFHSFNVGLVHVIMFSSEAASIAVPIRHRPPPTSDPSPIRRQSQFFNVGAHSLLMLPDQFAFVEADLKAVDRSVTPWIITMAHQRVPNRRRTYPNI